MVWFRCIADKDRDYYFLVGFLDVWTIIKVSLVLRVPSAYGVVAKIFILGKWGGLTTLSCNCRHISLTLNNRLSCLGNSLFGPLIFISW